MTETSVWAGPGGLGAKLALALFVLFGVAATVVAPAAFPSWRFRASHIQTVFSTVLGLAVIGGVINAFYWPQALEADVSPQRLSKMATTANWIGDFEHVVATILFVGGVCLVTLSPRWSSRLTLGFLTLALAALGWWLAVECGDNARWFDLKAAGESLAYHDIWPWFPYIALAVASLLGIAAVVYAYLVRRRVQSMARRYTQQPFIGRPAIRRQPYGIRRWRQRDSAEELTRRLSRRMGWKLLGQRLGRGFLRAMALYGMGWGIFIPPSTPPQDDDGTTDGDKDK